MPDRTRGGVRYGKIAVVGPHPPFRGGISHFSERFSAHLEEAGIDVLRVSFSRMYPSLLFPGRSQYEPVPSDSASGRDAALPAALDLVDSLNPLSWRRTSRMILAEDCSVAVFMYWMPFIAPAYACIARGLRNAGVRTIGIVHNVLPHERHPGDASLSRSFLTRCDEIITLSEDVGIGVRKLLPGTDPLLMEHPIYDQFGPAVERTHARGALGLDDEDLVILFFGIVRAYKGLNVLLDAMPEVIKHHDRVRLVIAGEFYEDRSRYEKQISRLGLEDRIVLRDEYIPSSDVATYFCAADVLVQPYTSATQSGVVQIAAQFGMPAIVTDTGGLGRQIGPDHPDRVVPASDPGALSGAVIKFFDDREKHGPEEDTRPVDAKQEPPGESNWGAYVAYVRSQFEKTT